MDSRLPPFRQLLVPIIVVFALLALQAHFIRQDLGAELLLSLWLGAAFGVVLQRTRFCFYCDARDFLERRDARGLWGIVLALALGTLGYHAVFGAFLPSPELPRLPPNAHIGPVSWVLALGALAFGMGMALAGSCISAQLYRLGEGALGTLLALLGTVLGFALGFLCWNRLYLLAVHDAPVLWLPHHLGYGGSLLLQLAFLGVLGLLLLWGHRPQADEAAPWWRARWSKALGGALVAGIATLAFLRVAPLGVTAELGSWGRTAAQNAGLLPDKLLGLDSFRGCITAVKDVLWSRNGAFILALVLGSLAAASWSGSFSLKLPTRHELWRNLLGGLLMGWGAMLALGCTVGTLLSGVMAGAVSGWVFALLAGFGLWLGWRLRRHLPG